MRTLLTLTLGLCLGFCFRPIRSKEAALRLRGPSPEPGPQPRPANPRRLLERVSVLCSN